MLALFKSSTAFWLVLPAGILNAVGPEYPSGASAHTLSPEISTGYVKYKKALAIRAGLKIFMPTPPKISFPITIPNEVAMATCHNGIDGGNVSGIRAHVTRKPSEIGCFLTTPKSSSQNAPDAKLQQLSAVWM